MDELQSLLQDVRYGFRMLVRTPGATAAALLAVFFPACRATRVDPVVAFRHP